MLTAVCESVRERFAVERDAVELGVDRARLDQNDFDAERMELDAKCIGHRFDGVFRGVVRAEERQRDATADAARR